MAELNESYILMRCRLQYEGQNFWYRWYLFGRTLPSFDSDEILNEIVDYCVREEGMLTKLLNTMSISIQMKWLALQVVYPERSAWSYYHFSGLEAKGNLICGFQPPQATCRVNYYSSPASLRAHWFQLSPVPTFTEILSPSRIAYLELVESLTDVLSEGFTTVPGNIYRFAYRDKDSNFATVQEARGFLFDSTDSRRTRRI